MTGPQAGVNYNRRHDRGADGLSRFGPGLYALFAEPSRYQVGLAEPAFARAQAEFGVIPLPAAGEIARGTPARAPGHGGHPSGSRCAVGSWGGQCSRRTWCHI